MLVLNDFMAGVYVGLTTALFFATILMYLFRDKKGRDENDI